MNIIDSKIKYTNKELDNIFSKFNNLDVGNYRIDSYMIELLSKTKYPVIIKFINMFDDINKFDNVFNKIRHTWTLAGNIVLTIMRMCKNKRVYVYKIMDHLLKLNMNVTLLYVFYGDNKTSKTCMFSDEHARYNNLENHKNVMYMINNFTAIQNVRKIINNYDILLFDITDDLQFIKQILLITKCKHKNVPKFIITHKILYYYLLNKNEINNI